MIGNSEREDFRNTIEAAGLSPDAFELTEKEDPGPISPHWLQGTVTIRRTSTGIEKTYKAGIGSTWSAQFEEDLKGGYFD